MKKAQVTVFIIVSIVIAASFALLFSISQSMAESKSKRTADIAYAEMVHKSAVKKFVDGCLESATKSAIFQLSSQGGFFFSGQDSLVDWGIPNVSLPGGGSVAFQIYRPEASLVESGFLYPCYKNNQFIPSTMFGQFCYEHYSHDLPYYIFGSTGDPVKNVNPDLCSAYNYSRAGYDCFCEECNGFSIESQLEVFISKRLDECVDTSSLSDYNLSKGSPEVDLVIGTEDIIANLNFPLRVTLLGGSTPFDLSGFSVRIPIRLKVVYDAVREIIQQDIKNISFDISSDPYGFNIPFLSFDHVPLIDDSAYLFTINDSSSLIGGFPFQFRFAIKNRQPALDYFNPDDCFVGGEYFHVCAVEGEKIFFDPIAYDPDDSPLFFMYNGWKADWDDIFGPSSSNPVPHSSSLNISSNLLHSSDPYISSHRRASIQTGPLDIGPHNLTISVVDPFGLIDSQLVKVFVDSHPSVYFVVRSPYSDIPIDFASSEDPFIFDASSTIDPFSGNTNFLFSWSDGGDLDLGFSYSNRIVDFPLLIYNTFSSSDFSGEAGTRQVTLNVMDSFSSSLGQFQKPVDIFSCLPHRSPAAPYPFHDYLYDNYPSPLNLDPFQSNHTCCSDGTDGFSFGEVTPGETCYELVDFGCLFHFDSSDSRHVDPSGVVFSSGQNPSSSLVSSNPTRELFRRELSVSCGNRGNTCDGPLAVNVYPTGTFCDSNCLYSFTSPSSACI